MDLFDFEIGIDMDNHEIIDKVRINISDSNCSEDDNYYIVTDDYGTYYYQDFEIFIENNCSQDVPTIQEIIVHLKNGEYFIKIINYFQYSHYQSSAITISYSEENGVLIYTSDRDPGGERRYVHNYKNILELSDYITLFEEILAIFEHYKNHIQCPIEQSFQFYKPSEENLKYDNINVRKSIVNYTVRRVNFAKFKSAKKN